MSTTVWVVPSAVPSSAKVPGTLQWRPDAVLPRAPRVPVHFIAGAARRCAPRREYHWVCGSRYSCGRKNYCWDLNRNSLGTVGTVGRSQYWRGFPSAKVVEQCQVEVGTNPDSGSERRYSALSRQHKFDQYQTGGAGPVHESADTPMDISGQTMDMSILSASTLCPAGRRIAVPNPAARMLVYQPAPCPVVPMRSGIYARAGPSAKRGITEKATEAQQRTTTLTGAHHEFQSVQTH